MDNDVEKSAVTSAIRPVVEKWLDGNAISNALLHNRGEFFQYVKSKFMATTVNQRSTDDHGYVSTSHISYNERKTQPFWINFNILKVLPNFKPCSVDVERLFLLGRISKIFLQSKLSTSSHSHNRNVFLNKNHHFLPVFK